MLASVMSCNPEVSGENILISNKMKKIIKKETRKYISKHWFAPLCIWKEQRFTSLKHDSSSGSFLIQSMWCHYVQTCIQQNKTHKRIAKGHVVNFSITWMQQSIFSNSVNPSFLVTLVLQYRPAQRRSKEKPDGNQGRLEISNASSWYRDHSGNGENLMCSHWLSTLLFASERIGFVYLDLHRPTAPCLHWSLW